MAQSEVKNKALVKFVGVVAGIFGEIQGIVWTISSFLCILCYFDVIHVEPTLIVTDYGTMIYFWFLKKPDAEYPGDDIVIKQSGFFAFMWIYFFLSLLWTIESSCVLWAMTRDKWEHTKYFFAGWSGIGAVTSILDIIFMSMLAADLKFVKDMGTVGGLDVAYGIVMTMAARGYILLIINIALSILTGMYAKDLWNTDGPDMPIIYGYETETVNPPWVQDKQDPSPWASSPEYRSPYYSNQSYTPDNNSHGFERSQSFLPAMPPSAPISRPAPPSSNNSRAPLPSSSSDKTATIGKPGRRSPPQSKGPIIPDPDYSPPGTPNALKSVLRSKSNY